MPTIKEVGGGGMMDGGQWKKNAGLFLPYHRCYFGGLHPRVRASLGRGANWRPFCTNDRVERVALVSPYVPPSSREEAQVIS